VEKRNLKIKERGKKEKKENKNNNKIYLHNYYGEFIEKNVFKMELKWQKVWMFYLIITGIKVKIFKK